MHHGMLGPTRGAEWSKTCDPPQTLHVLALDSFPFMLSQKDLVLHMHAQPLHPHQHRIYLCRMRIMYQ